MTQYKSKADGHLVDAVQVEGDTEFVMVETHAGQTEAAPGTWRLTYEDGWVALCHPDAFAEQYEEV